MRAMQREYSGLVAVVTGAASGIGLAVARGLLARGASVAFADRDERGLETAIAGPFRRRAYPIVVDVTSEPAVDRLFASVAKKFGQLHALVNSAGVVISAPVDTTASNDWHRALSVNLTGSFLCSRAAARAMKPLGGGRIVNISSHSGTLGSAGRAAYAASKGGLNALTRAAAVDLAAHGITVNAVAPGPVETPLVTRTHGKSRRRAWAERLPLGRYTQADEIAAAVLFLLSSGAAQITGQVIPVDGGFSIAGLMPGRRVAMTSLAPALPPDRQQAPSKSVPPSRKPRGAVAGSNSGDNTRPGKRPRQRKTPTGWRTGR